MTSRQNKWTREELILTLSVYFQLPFGRLNHITQEMKELAQLIGCTDNSTELWQLKSLQVVALVCLWMLHSVAFG